MPDPPSEDWNIVGLFSEIHIPQNIRKIEEIQLFLEWRGMSGEQIDFITIITSPTGKVQNKNGRVTIPEDTTFDRQCVIMHNLVIDEAGDYTLSVMPDGASFTRIFSVHHKPPA